MYRVEIRKPEPGRSTLPDFGPSDSFIRIAENDEGLEDLRSIFGDRIIAVTTVPPNTVSGATEGEKPRREKEGDA